ncbi:MAG: GIY-YIG nuclease family protein [Polaromonas sp.]|nr:GIY-YIG nuclease family protein [Polaromonas sp.]
MSDLSVNLYVTYSLICNRKNKGSTAPGARKAAHDAADKAKLFITNPCSATLADFRHAEEKWSKAASGKNKSYADDFERALQAGNYHVKKIGVNTAWNSNHQPPEGFIYGAIAIGQPGWMKLGATTDSPLDRIAAFARRYKLSDMRLMYYAHVEKPMSVEDEIRKCLRTYRRQRSAKDSREWFDVDPIHAMQTAQNAIARLGVKVFVPVVPSKQLLVMMDAQEPPTVWLRHGGRLAERAAEKADIAHAPADLVSRVAAHTSPFHVGATVIHKKRGQDGHGIVVTLNRECLTVKFPMADKLITLETKSACDFLALISNA